MILVVSARFPSPEWNWLFVCVSLELYLSKIQTGSKRVLSFLHFYWFPIFVFGLNSFRCIKSTHTVIKVAIPSAVGDADHPPSRPHILGNNKIAGIKNNTCRERLKNIDMDAFPIDWKKFVMTICAPTMGNIIMVILSPTEETSIRCVSVVNALAR